MDAVIIHKAARRIAGTDTTAKREIINALADVKTAGNHYILQVANRPDRIMRANKTVAQERAKTFLQQHYCASGIEEPETDNTKLQ